MKNKVCDVKAKREAEHLFHVVDIHHTLTVSLW